jgi:hypothetical protein
MVFVMAHKRQHIIAGLIVLLLLLASLLPALNPALAQSCPTPTATVSPSSGSWGDSVTLQGEGWLPGGEVTVTIRTSTNPEPLSSAPVAGTDPVPDSGKWEATIFGQNVTLPPGDYVFVFSENKDGCELRAMAPFTSNEPTMNLDPTEGPPGTKVTVQGSGWVGDIGGKKNGVSLQFAEPGNEVVQAPVDNQGNFATTFTVPADAQRRAESHSYCS